LAAEWSVEAREVAAAGATRTMLPACRAGCAPAHGFPPAVEWTKEQEMDALRAQAQSMEEALESVRQRLQELEKE
jgi:hypothetical protein